MQGACSDFSLIKDVPRRSVAARPLRRTPAWWRWSTGPDRPGRNRRLEQVIVTSALTPVAEERSGCCPSWRAPWVPTAQPYGLSFSLAALEPLLFAPPSRSPAAGWAWDHGPARWWAKAPRAAALALGDWTARPAVPPASPSASASTEACSPGWSVGASSLGGHSDSHQIETGSPRPVQANDRALCAQLARPLGGRWPASQAELQWGMQWPAGNLATSLSKLIPWLAEQGVCCGAAADRPADRTLTLRLPPLTPTWPDRCADESCWDLGRSAAAAPMWMG